MSALIARPLPRKRTLDSGREKFSFHSNFCLTFSLFSVAKTMLFSLPCSDREVIMRRTIRPAALRSIVAGVSVLPSMFLRDIDDGVEVAARHNYQKPLIKKIIKLRALNTFSF